MNNKTKIIIGVGIAALLFMFRKQIFGGGSESETTEETFVPDTTGPSETVEAPKETSGDTAFKPFVPPVPVKPSLVNVNPGAASPNTNVTPRVDSAVFFSAPNSALTR
jgi:hypothetical protein